MLLLGKVAAEPPLVFSATVCVRLVGFCVSLCVRVCLCVNERSRRRRALDVEVFSSVISLSVQPNHFHVGPPQQQRGGGPHMQRWESHTDTQIPMCSSM